MNRKIYKALIFLNGDEENLSYAKKYAKRNMLVIGCDGGADSAYKLGLKPNIIIGDFDSINNLPKQIQNLPEDSYGKEIAADGTIYIRHYSDKDFLDAEAAINYAVDNGINEITLVNTGGEELDHVIGVLMVIARTKYKNVDIKIIRPKLIIYIGREHITIEGKPKDKVSLIPLYGPAKVESSKGLKYDPAKYQMSLEHNIGISNELISKKATLHASKGCFLIIQHY